MTSGANDDPVGHLHRFSNSLLGFSRDELAMGLPRDVVLQVALVTWIYFILSSLCAPVMTNESSFALSGLNFQSNVVQFPESCSPTYSDSAREVRSTMFMYSIKDNSIFGPSTLFHAMNNAQFLTVAI